MRARGFFLCLALGLAGWVLFLGVAMATRLDSGIDRWFAELYGQGLAP